MAYLSAARMNPRTMSPADGSRTVIVTDSNPREEDEEASGPGLGGRDEEGRVDGVLHLRGGRRTRPNVRWTEDTVNNEGMGKKSSKSEFYLDASLIFGMQFSSRLLRLRLPWMRHIC